MTFLTQNGQREKTKLKPESYKIFSEINIAQFCQVHWSYFCDGYRSVSGLDNAFNKGQSNSNVLVIS